MTVETFIPCPRCGAAIAPADKVCRNCGLLRHHQRLERLAAEAVRLEPTNRPAAIELWRECLNLLPPQAPQYAMVAQRIDVLGAAFDSSRTSPRPVAPKPPDPLHVAAAKTTLSMLISIAIYSTLLGWPFATGFVLLILIHELGHVAAMRYYGLNAGPPIFIPFLGAVINMRQPPKNAKVEAVVGIGGPIAGTIGALICFAWFVMTGSSLALHLSFFGFLLNLFNLLPIPPLDGGRITAAVSPKIWIIGLMLMGVIVGYDIVRGRFNPILILILVFAWPRIWATLRGGINTGDYYRITPRASRTIATMYVGLAILLTGFYLYTNQMRGEMWL